MKSPLKSSTSLVAAGLLAFASSASAITIDWNQAGSTVYAYDGNGDPDGSPSDFDNAEMTFSGILVGDYLGATSNSAFFHDHDPDGTTIFALDLRINGSWVNVWSFDPADDSDNYLSSFGGATLGSSVLLDGIRFTTSQQVGYAYHAFDMASEFGPEYADSFHFKDVPVATPDTGATAALLGLALGAIALARRRR